MTQSLEEFTETLLALGITTPESSRLNDNGTLYDARPVVERAKMELPQVASDIIVKSTIGHGGMGEIMLAAQTSLHRVVAVKRPLKGDDAAHDEIIVEALVVGALEHPNVVPVHALGKDEQGRPLLVMKRIEGKTWSQLMREGRDLSRDVDILMQVCRALHFAHSRGVIHRDVKPTNVMVGTFGEVYLLDWGIAVGLEHASIPGLRASQSAKTITGTPQYMAPEMAMPVTPPDQRTDVYLVGAVLHEVLTGRPPHEGKNLMEMVHAALLSREPVFARSVPEDLAAICRRAMSRDPNDRFASVEELRLALAQFDGRRAARALIDEADVLLETLRGLPLDADPAELQRTFNQCRFAYESALRVWPDSARAKDGRLQCLLVMVRREIDAGHLDSARLLISELATVPVELSNAFAALAERRTREASSAQTLEHLAKEQDEWMSGRPRALLALSFAVVNMAIVGTLAYLHTKNIFRESTLVLAVWAAMMTAVLILGYFKMPAMTQNEIGRATARAMIVTCIGLVIANGVAWIRGDPVETAVVAVQIVLVMSLGITGSFHPGLRLPIIVVFVGVPFVVVASLLGPAWALVASGIASITAMGTMPGSLTKGPPGRS